MCDILFDVCVAIVQNFMHIIYLKVVEFTKLSCDTTGKCARASEFLCTKRLLEKNYSYPTCTEKEERGSDRVWSLESLRLFL